MLTNREKRLLYLLAVVVVVAAASLFFYFRYNDLLDLETQINQTTLDIQRILTDTPDEEALLASIEVLKERIATEKSRFYREGEIQLSTFQSIATQFIEEHGLIVKKGSSESKPNQKYVEFQLEGNAYNLARFLKDVSNHKKYWSILEIKAENKKINGIYNGKIMDISLRITYEVYTANNS